METIVMIVVSALLGLLGVPFVDWIKGKLGVEDGKALLIAGALAAVLGTLQLVIAGQLGIADFSLDNLAYTFGVIFAAADVFFKLLKYGKGE